MTNNVISFDAKPISSAKCAFCGKSRDKVKILIGEEGRPHICDACVAKCTKLLEGAKDGS